MNRYSIERPFSTPVTIETSSYKIARMLALYYGKCFLPTTMIYPLIITIDERSEVGYSICFNGKTIITKSLLQEVSNLLYDNTSYDKNILALHGAAVEYDDQAHIFLAPTTGGKTTLTGYLVYKGCGYITDDCVLVDKKEMKVYSSKTPLHLRPKSLKILCREYALTIKPMLLDDGIMRRYVYFPENRIEEVKAIKGIYFLKRNEFRNTITNLNMADKIDAIMKSTTVCNPLDIEYFRFVAALSQKPCYELQYCDMDYVYKVVRTG